MNENRKHGRLVDVQLDVELIVEKQGCSLHSRDYSYSGIYLEKGKHNLPPEGAIVHLRIKNALGGGEDAPRVKARVIRVDDDGIALEFITDE